MHRRVINLLPVFGSLSTGVIYIAVGAIAFLSFLKIRDGGADESSMLAILNEYVVGKILIWLILLGTAGLVIWRFYEAVNDPYKYGKTKKGLLKRAGIALSSLADILIVYTAMRVLLGNGKYDVNGLPTQEQDFVRQLLEKSYGGFLIVSMGAVLIVTALIQLIYGVTQGYKERLTLSDHAHVRRSVHILAWLGYFSRGLILGITGFFFLKAGITKDERYIVNTDKAFDFIGDHIGHAIYIATALGTMCYGFFMMAMGITYNTKGTDKDKVH